MNDIVLQTLMLKFALVPIECPEKFVSASREGVWEQGMAQAESAERIAELRDLYEGQAVLVQQLKLALLSACRLLKKAIAARRAKVEKRAKDAQKEEAEKQQAELQKRVVSAQKALEFTRDAEILFIDLAECGHSALRVIEKDDGLGKVGSPEFYDTPFVLKGSESWARAVSDGQKLRDSKSSKGTLDLWESPGDGFLKPAKERGLSSVQHTLTTAQGADIVTAVLQVVLPLDCRCAELATPALQADLEEVALLGYLPTLCRVGYESHQFGALRIVTSGRMKVAP